MPPPGRRTFLPETPPSDAKPDLADLLRHGGIWRDVPATEIFPTLGRILKNLPAATPDALAGLTDLLTTAGSMNWGCIGDGLAMPHLRAPSKLALRKGLLAILFLHDATPLPQAPPDGVPVKTLLFFVAPTPRAHLHIAGQLSANLIHGKLMPLLAARADDSSIFASLSNAG